MSALAAVAPCGVLAPRQASRQQTAARLGAPLAAPARQQRQQRCAAPSSRRCAASRRCLVVAEAAQAEVRRDWGCWQGAGAAGLARPLPPPAARLVHRHAPTLCCTTFPARLAS